MTFVVVMLAIAMVAGFAYGYYLQKPKQHDESTGIFILPEEKEDLQSTTARQSTTADSADNKKEEAVEPQTDPEESTNFQSVLSRLLETGKLPEETKIETFADEPEKLASKETHKQPAQTPQNVTVEIVNFDSGSDDKADQSGDKSNDPEQEMYTFQDNAEKPSELDENAKQGDIYQKKALDRLAAWNKSRAQRELDRAKVYLRRAQDYYHKSLAAKETDYVKQQLHQTDQFLYLAIKSSSVSVRHGRR